MKPQRRVMNIWAIFRNPAGSGYLANRCEIHQGKAEPVPTADFLVEQKIETLREHFRRRGFVAVARKPEDQPNLVECWM